jgi:hypothetical protein
MQFSLWFCEKRKNAPIPAFQGMAQFMAISTYGVVSSFRENTNPGVIHSICVSGVAT